MKRLRFPVLRLTSLRLTTYHIEAFGGALFCTGVGLVWPPAGIMAAGIFLILAALVYTLAKERRS